MSTLFRPSISNCTLLLSVSYYIYITFYLLDFHLCSCTSGIACTYSGVRTSFGSPKLIDCLFYFSSFFTDFSLVFAHHADEVGCIPVDFDSTATLTIFYGIGLPLRTLDLALIGFYFHFLFFINLLFWVHASYSDVKKATRWYKANTKAKDSGGMAKAKMFDLKAKAKTEDEHR